MTGHLIKLPPPPVAVVRTLSVRDVVGDPVLQHEPGRQLRPHRRHGAGAELQLEGHPVGVRPGVRGLLLRLPAAHQERAQRRGAAQRGGSGQEEQKRSDTNRRFRGGVHYRSAFPL